MNRHSAQTIQDVRTDRMNGHSISELMKKYSLPKSTVWHQIQHVQISDETRKSLRSRQGSSKVRSQLKWEQARVIAEEYLKEVSFEEIWVAVIASLYWSEGTKKSGFVFTNTDPEMIKVFLKILQTRLSVKDEDLDILIRTSIPMDPEVCRKYWAEVIGFPLSSIRINHSADHNKSKTTYGICRITLRKGGAHLKLMHCLIRGLTDKMLGHVPVV